MTCLAGAVQLRPIPAAELNQLVTEAADPASVQHCTTASRVRYCLYPGFGRDLPSLEAPVSGVLAQLPARPGQPLTVRQVGSWTSLITTLTHGHPRRQVSRWNSAGAAGAGQRRHGIGHLPAGRVLARGGGQLADAHFDLALAAAEWAVRLPLQAPAPADGPCHACRWTRRGRRSRSGWRSWPPTPLPASSRMAWAARTVGFEGAEVRDTIVSTWDSPGVADGYLAPSLCPQTTAAGYLLANAMTGLPEPKVSQVLAGAWATG